MTQEQSGDNLFNNFSEINQAKGDSEPKSDSVGIGTLSQQMKISPKMSDTQIVDKRLFPILKETVEWLNNLMVARVFPETLNPLRNLIVKHLIQEYPEMSFTEAICIAEVALTVAIDGEGRMDIIHLFSKMSESGTDDKKDKLV